jgi:uncharacterized protein (DUF488 family)
MAKAGVAFLQSLVNGCRFGAGHLAPQCLMLPDDVRVQWECRMSEIFTIGYEQASLADFLRALQAAGVTRLIDVRDLPQSRRAGFSKRQLSASAGELGIDYVHLKPLGTPKEGRVAHRSGDHATFWRIVETQLAKPEAQAALDEAARLAQERPSCLVCFEGKWQTCHRARVADLLAEKHGFHATHLVPEPVFV